MTDHIRFAKIDRRYKSVWDVDNLDKLRAEASA
jgi:hypothetical protein